MPKKKPSRMGGLKAAANKRLQNSQATTKAFIKKHKNNLTEKAKRASIHTTTAVEGKMAMGKAWKEAVFGGKKHHDPHPSQPARLQAGDRTWAYAE